MHIFTNVHFHYFYPLLQIFICALRYSKRGRLSQQISTYTTFFLLLCRYIRCRSNCKVVFFRYISYIQGFVVLNIVKVLWSKCKKMFSEGAPPWEMSKQGSLRKSFFFFSYPTSKYYFKEYRPHCSKSYILWTCLSVSQSAAQPQRGLPCGLFMATAGFMVRKNRPDLLFSALTAQAKA